MKAKAGRAILAAAGLAAAAAPPAGAIPNSFFGGDNAPVIVIPAFPRFGADLTAEFLDRERWRDGGFSGPWQEEPADEGLLLRRMTANPVVFGEVPMAVVRRDHASGSREIAIHHLDAGLFFG